jgi:hypothetical protein
VSLRDAVIETIEIALVELRPIAQPRDMAELNELLLDAKDAATDESLSRIATQVASLRKFCEGRHFTKPKLGPRR